MSVSRIKTACAAIILAATAPSALAQNLPLALPPEAQDPIVISAPEPPALALPPSVYAPPPTAQPVQATQLNDIKPETIGLLVNHDGGLGADMWKGTSRAYAERFMEMLALPLPYAVLNDLARRFLLTTASPPESQATPSPRNITTLRIEKLVALGNADEAWKLAKLDGPGHLDDTTLRQLSEAALISPAADEICTWLPAIIKIHIAIEWQKTMVVCQLRAKDVKAAQVSLDLLHAQNVKDETFFTLAEKILIGGNKQLPRQLTPLKPLNLALLQLTGLPLRAEVYTRPDAVLIPALLKTATEDTNALIALAERSAAKGIIGTADLADIYRAQNFPADLVATANISGEQGPKLRALLFQASQQEKNPKNRINEALKFTDSLDQDLMDGGMLEMAGTIMGNVTPSAEFNADAAAIARSYILAGNPSNALSWLDLTQNAARSRPQEAINLQNIWPLLALDGI